MQLGAAVAGEGIEMVREMVELNARAAEKARQGSVISQLC